MFQGKYYAKYASYDKFQDTNTPYSGYPKLISSSFKITSFTKDFTGIAYANDSQVYVFQDMKYTKIDLLSGEYSGYPRTLTDDFKVLHEIINCGKVTAAYSHNSGYGLTLGIWCDNIVGYAHEKYTFSTLNTLTGIFDSSYADKKVTAFYNTPDVNTISTAKLFTTNVSSRRRRMADEDADEDSSISQYAGQSIFTGTNISSFDEIKDWSCNDDKVCFLWYNWRKFNSNAI